VVCRCYLMSVKIVLTKVTGMKGTMIEVRPGRVRRHFLWTSCESPTRGRLRGVGFPVPAGYGLDWWPVREPRTLVRRVVTSTWPGNNPDDAFNATSAAVAVSQRSGTKPCQAVHISCSAHAS
jgi:hypothetical protein